MRLIPYYILAIRSFVSFFENISDSPENEIFAWAVKEDRPMWLIELLYFLLRPRTLERSHV